MGSDTRTTSRRWREFALFAGAIVLVLALSGCSGSGSSASGAPGTATAAGVQHFDVDMSKGSYVPNELDAKAGTPVQITFGQGKGCVGTLVFPSFSIRADMTQGPKTFDLGVLQPGEYPWSCGMNMQHGVLKVQ